MGRVKDFFSHLFNNDEHCLEINLSLNLDFGPGSETVEDKDPRPKFYRYVRVADEKNYLLPGPNGGVTFLICLDAEAKEFTFSYALCNRKDNFSKVEGRVLAALRMDNGEVYKIVHYDAGLSVVQNITLALSVFTKDVVDTPVLSELPFLVSKRDLELLYTTLLALQS